MKGRLRRGRGTVGVGRLERSLALASKLGGSVGRGGLRQRRADIESTTTTRLKNSPAPSRKTHGRAMRVVLRLNSKMWH